MIGVYLAHRYFHNITQDLVAWLFYLKRLLSQLSSLILPFVDNCAFFYLFKNIRFLLTL